MKEKDNHKDIFIIFSSLYKDKNFKEKKIIPGRKKNFWRRTVTNNCSEQLKQKTEKKRWKEANGHDRIRSNSTLFYTHVCYYKV
jgi:hypothetical protein